MQLRWEKRKKKGNLQSDIKELYWKKEEKARTYCKSLDLPWSFPALLSQALALPLSFQLGFWGRGCCADSQVCAPGGAASPPARCRAQWELFTP